MFNPFVAGWIIGGPQTLKRRSLVGQREDELEGEVGCCFRTLKGTCSKKKPHPLALTHGISHAHCARPLACAVELSGVRADDGDISHQGRQTGAIYYCAAFSILNTGDRVFHVLHRGHQRQRSAAKVTMKASSLHALLGLAPPVMRHWNQAEDKAIQYTSVGGYFLQDDPNTNPSGFDYVRQPS